jgi:hypothetical protein
MRGDRPQDALAIIALAAGVAVLVAARHAGDWIAALGRSLHHAVAAASAPSALLLCLVLVGATVAAVLWRRRVCRDQLADRIELQLVETFEAAVNGETLLAEIRERSSYTICRLDGEGSEGKRRCEQDPRGASGQQR